MAGQLVMSDFVATDAQSLSEDAERLKVPFLPLAIATASTVPSGDGPSSPRGRVLGNEMPFWRGHGEPRPVIRC